MDRGAWPSTVLGVANSQTQLSNWTSMQSLGSHKSRVWGRQMGTGLFFFSFVFFEVCGGRWYHEAAARDREDEDWDREGRKHGCRCVIELVTTFCPSEKPFLWRTGCQALSYIWRVSPRKISWCPDHVCRLRETTEAIHSKAWERKGSVGSWDG